MFDRRMDIKTELSENFALRIVNLYQFLLKKNERIMCKQILRSGTSIGANIAESIYAESTDDMKHKLSISLKEASETRFWLRILYRSSYIDNMMFVSLNNDCESIIKLLTKIIKTLKQ